MKKHFRAVKALAEQFYEEQGDDAPLLIMVLLAAEDRRGRWHIGIDPISIVRAVLTGFRSGRVCGLSTVEQQLARRLVPRRASPLRCKPREMALATAIALRNPKSVIWAAYLQCAYYGADWDTLTDVKAAFQECADAPLELVDACKIVACLKYPGPDMGGVDRHGWELLHARRVDHLTRLTKTSQPHTPPSPWRAGTNISAPPGEQAGLISTPSQLPLAPNLRVSPRADIERGRLP